MAEIWFPYRGIGPLSRATPAAAVSVDATGGTIRLGLFALEAIDDELIVFLLGEGDLPGAGHARSWAVFKKDVPLTAPTEKPSSVKLGDKKIYESDPAADDLGRPYSFKPADESTADGLFRRESGPRKERLLRRGPREVPGLSEPAIRSTSGP